MLKQSIQNAKTQSFDDARALYIHWPFCLSKCPYCDFNSHVQIHLGSDDMVAALCLELQTLAQRFVHPQKLQSIFFGGGTPSLMPPLGVEKLISCAEKSLGLVPDCEITLEANPTNFERTRFKDFHRAGVNRLSIGVQSFQGDMLKVLGRNHNAGQARAAIAHSQDIFERTSFDLMYGLPGQSVEAWQEELREAAVFEPTHMSCYQLTFEPGTAFYTRYHRGELNYPQDDVATEFDDLTETFWAQRGLKRYEVSNYAKPGYESRHNLSYWFYEPTLGVGPGAHGRPVLAGKKRREVTHRHPETWLEAVQKNGHGLKESLPLSPSDIFEERLMMGLRLSGGVSFQNFSAKERQALRARADILVQTGLVDVKKNALRVTPQGRLRLNSVVRFMTEAV